MLEIRNHTPLSVSLVPGLDKEGVDFVTTIMKGKFTIVPGQSRLKFADEPATIFQADEYFGEPDKSSVRYEADVAMRKRGTDIVVNGHAYAPNGRAISVDASVQVGNSKKTCRVFGDRLWEKSKSAVMSWAPSRPAPFERMPLGYEHAFGGVDPKTPQGQVPQFSAANPIGKGFQREPTEGLPLPNIEDPRHLIERWEDRPAPAGFGFIGRGWKPRVDLAGTCDAHWKQTRFPLLPADFDDRYFNGAHPDLITPGLLRGGERVALTQLCASGPLSFDLPVWTDPVTVVIKGDRQVYIPVLDTIVIEPDDLSALITWRVTAPCPKTFLYIDSVIVGKARAA